MSDERKGRKLYAKVPCVDKEARDAILRAFECPTFRAAAIIIGTMMPFTAAEQRRMMTYLKDRFIDNPEPEAK